MKKMTFWPLLLVMALLFVAACSKTGPEGPAGATGATGAAGATGPSGPAGADGSKIYSGNGAPAASVGANGDFYLDLTSGKLYGPKAASGWGTGFSLVGPQGTHGTNGTNGTNGNTMLNGSGAPSASLGNTGDFYLDTSGYLLFGPKTASGWGTATSLKGPPGTANVEYSGWNYATNFRDTTIDASNLAVGNLSAPALTQSNLDNASIMVYLNFGAGVFPLPYSSDASGTTSIISFQPQVGQFLITRYTDDNSASAGLSTIIQYRYVIIPGAQNVGAVQQHIDLKNYEAVKRYFRIPD